MVGTITSIAPIVSNAYDPTSYLSTIVLSTATIIAIIGGFLISRLIALSSEKNSLVEKKKILEGKRKIPQENLSEVTNRMHKRAMGWFKQDSLKAVVQNPNIEVDNLCNKQKYPGEISEKKLITAISLIFDSQQFHEILERQFPDLSDIPTDEPSLVAAGIHRDNAEDLEMATEIAHKLNSQRKILREKKASEEANDPNNLLSKVIGIFAVGEVAKYFKPARIPPWIGIAPLKISRDHGSDPDLKKKIEDEIHSLDAEIKIFKDALASRANPTGMVHGFTVLVFFGIVGILIPLFDMTKNPVTMNISQRHVVYLMFFSGLAWLLIYFATSIWSLLRDK